jgi:hypothetical protein
MTPLGDAQNVVLSRCCLLVNMTNGVKLSYYRGNTKHKKYELQDIYNEFKQYRLYEILTYNSKQIQIFSRTLEIRVQRSPVLPT